MTRFSTREDQPITPLDLVFGAVIWFGIVALIAVVFVPPTAGNWTDTAKAIGAAIGMGTAIFVPISSIVMARYQSQLTTKLEGLKTDYTREVEGLKTTLAAGLEIKKALIASRIRAFDTMLSAAHFFYHALRQMAFFGDAESEKMLQEAAKRAADANSVVWHLSPEDKLRWYRVAQCSITFGSELKDAPAEKRKEVFNSNAGELGVAIDDLEKAGLAAFEDADKWNVRLTGDV